MTNLIDYHIPEAIQIRVTKLAVTAAPTPLIEIGEDVANNNNSSSDNNDATTTTTTTTKAKRMKVQLRCLIAGSHQKLIKRIQTQAGAITMAVGNEYRTSFKCHGSKLGK